jgi:hypothetical protein
MSHRVIAGLLLAAAFGLAAGPAGADGSDLPRPVHRSWHGYDLRLPPERHVIEVVDAWGRLIISGRRFTPAVPACGHWVAGERIKFLEGDILGACRSALIYNYRWRDTCEVSCPWGFAIW